MLKVYEQSLDDKIKKTQYDKWFKETMKNYVFCEKNYKIYNKFVGKWNVKICHLESWAKPKELKR